MGTQGEFPVQTHALFREVFSAAWKRYMRHSRLFRPPQHELILEAKVAVGEFTTSAKVLIDTGSRIPLLFRSGLIPANL